MKLTDIRPYHLNDLYKHLAENGIRNKGAIATAKKVVRKKVAALKLPKCAIVKEAGFSQTTLNAILRGDSVTYANAEKLATYYHVCLCISSQYDANIVSKQQQRGKAHIISDKTKKSAYLC
jgi:hypothetical protein